jgi:hypothetical protein
VLWCQDEDRRVGVLEAKYDHRASPSIYYYAQFIVDACNEKEQKEQREFTGRILNDAMRRKRIEDGCDPDTGNPPLDDIGPLGAFEAVPSTPDAIVLGVRPTITPGMVTRQFVEHAPEWYKNFIDSADIPPEGIDAHHSS